MGKKTLAFMYIGESLGFHGEKFNFSTEEIFDVKETKEDGLSLCKVPCNNKLPENFWKDDILAMHLLVGGNGAGKTTVMRLLCQWVCQLSQKKIPQETGILVFKEDIDYGYIAFSNGKEMLINTGISKMELNEDGYFSDFFQDISLIYCSNTMTELKISGYDIFQDYSLPFRIREANANGHAMEEDITANYECYEFDRQIAVALKDDKFPIDYMILEIRTYPLDVFEGLLLYHKGDIGQELGGLMDGKEMGSSSENGSGAGFVKGRLLHALFIGILVKLLKWGKTYQINGKNQVEEVLSRSEILREYLSSTQNEGEKVKRFFQDLFNECKEYFAVGGSWQAYTTYWGDMESYVARILDFMKEKQNEGFFDGWTTEPNSEKTDGEKYTWKLNLKEHKEEFGRFWNIYKEKAYLVENIHFSWDASSGQKNWAQLFSVLKSGKVSGISKEHKTIWYLLDEPDNTFHPEWERILISEIVAALNDGCGKKQLWISTHSPIMLSDMPGQAVTCLKNTLEGKKVVDQTKKHTFGQNIYALFDDAFFLENGVMGEFASKKIIDTVVRLEKIQKILLEKHRQGRPWQDERKISEISEKIEKYSNIVDMVEEPLFGEQMRYYLKSCKKLLERVKQSD